MSREYTNKLIEVMEDGAIDPKILARDLLGFLSEAEVKEFIEANDLGMAIGMMELDDEEE